MNKNEIPFGDYCRAQEKNLPENICPWWDDDYNGDCVPEGYIGTCVYKNEPMFSERKICGISQGDPYQCKGCGRNELGCCCDD